MVITWNALSLPYALQIYIVADLQMQNESLILSLTQMTVKMEEEVVEKMNLQERKASQATPPRSPVMIADAQALNCMECKAVFSFTKRKVRNISVFCIAVKHHHQRTTTNNNEQQKTASL